MKKRGDVREREKRLSLPGVLRFSGVCWQRWSRMVLGSCETCLLYPRSGPSQVTGLLLQHTLSSRKPPLPHPSGTVHAFMRALCLSCLSHPRRRSHRLITSGPRSSVFPPLGRNFPEDENHPVHLRSPRIEHRAWRRSHSK